MPVPGLCRTQGPHAQSPYHLRCRLPNAPARSLFLRKLRTELRIPVLALVDSDPYGLKVLSVYMKACKAAAL